MQLSNPFFDTVPESKWVNSISITTGSILLTRAAVDLLSSEFTVDDEEETDEPLDLVFVMCWSDQTYRLQHHPLLPDPDQPTIDSFLSLTSFSTKVVWKLWSVLK